MNRRIFLKGTLAGGTVALAASAGLLTPNSVLAAWPKDAYSAKSVEAATSSLLGGTATESSDVSIKAPDIAENGAVVPIKVETSLSNVESIAILSENNATPLTANFELGATAVPYVSTRIKMGKTSNVIAVVKAGGALYTAKKEVKVTIGGCGG